MVTLGSFGYDGGIFLFSFMFSSFWLRRLRDKWSDLDDLGNWLVELGMGFKMKIMTATLSVVSLINYNHVISTVDIYQFSHFTRKCPIVHIQYRILCLAIRLIAVLEVILR